MQSQDVKNQSALPERLRRLKPLLVADSRRAAWLWLLHRERNGVALDDFILQAANDAANQLLRERIARGAKVPEFVAQALQGK